MGIWHIPFSETLHMLNDMMSFIFTLGSARHLKCSNWVKITSCHSWIIHVDPVSCMRKSCNFHAVRSDPKMTGCSLTFMPKSQGFSRIYHAFLLTPLDSHWSVKSIADDAPKKNVIMDAWFVMLHVDVHDIFSVWSIVSILSLSHVSHLMTHRAWRHDQPVLKVLCEKALGTSTVQRCQLNENWEVQGIVKLAWKLKHGSRRICYFVLGMALDQFHVKLSYI